MSTRHDTHEAALAAARGQRRVTAAARPHRFEGAGSLAPSHGPTPWAAKVLAIAVSLGWPMSVLAQGQPTDTHDPIAEEERQAEDAPADAATQAAPAGTAVPTAATLDVTAFHAPPDVFVAGEAAQLLVVVAADWKLERLWAGVRLTRPSSADAGAYFEDACTRRGGQVARSAGTSYCEIELDRRDEHTFGANLYGELLQPPGVEYYIASRDLDGASREHFATHAHPYAVPVHGESDQTLRASRLDRHHGDTSQMRWMLDWTSFGRTMQPQETVAAGAEQRGLDRYSDSFWSTTLDYTFRPLGTLYAFSFGVTVMRGMIPTVDGQGMDTLNAPAGSSAPDPGMNDGYGELDFEFHRNFSAAARLNLGATEEGFAAGAGAKTRIGPRHATHVELGLDWISSIGGRYWMRFAWTTIPRVPMAFTVEATEHPATTYTVYDAMGERVEVAAGLATRLMLDVGVDLTDHLTVGVRGGYANRVSTLDAGFVTGLSASYSF